MGRSDERQPSVQNRKAGHLYAIEKELEAGIVLTGTEVKGFRTGQVQISEAFIRFDSQNRLNIYNAHIATYSYGTDANHDPTRTRVLLLKRHENQQVRQALQQKGMTAVPLKMYIKHGLIKLLIGLCKGKNLHDKRQDIKKRLAEREAERAVKNSFRR